MIPHMDRHPQDTAMDSPQDIVLDDGQSTGHAGGQSSGQSTGQTETGLTATEAARVAGVHPRTIRRAIAAGHLSAPKQDGAYHIDPADLAAWQIVHAPKAPPDGTVDSPQDRPVDTRVDSPRDAGQGVGHDGGQSTGQGQGPSTQAVTSQEGSAIAELWRALEVERAEAVAEAVASKQAMVDRLSDEVAYLRDRNNTEITYLRERLEHRDLELEQRSRELAAERERADVIQQLALQRIEALTATVADNRQDAPERAPEPPGRDEGVSEGDPSSWWGRTWRRITGA